MYRHALSSHLTLKCSDFWFMAKLWHNRLTFIATHMYKSTHCSRIPGPQKKILRHRNSDAHSAAWRLESPPCSVSFIYTPSLCKCMGIKPPRRSCWRWGPKNNNSLVKQRLQRFRGCLIRKVQKSSKVTASRMLQHFCNFRANLDILWHRDAHKGNKTRKGDGDTFPQGNTSNCVIFQTSHRRSAVWRIWMVHPVSVLTLQSLKLMQLCLSFSWCKPAETCFLMKRWFRGSCQTEVLVLSQYRFKQFLQGL